MQFNFVAVAMAMASVALAAEYVDNPARRSLANT